MVRFKQKFLAFFLASTLISGGALQGVKADPPVDAGGNVQVGQVAKSGGIFSGPIFNSALGSVIASMVPRLMWELIYRLDLAIEKAQSRYAVSNYAGFRDTPTIIKNLEDICENKSKIRVYGQDKAKEQMFNALSGIAARVDDMKRGRCDSRDMRGNIVYIAGPSGTGKSKMCYAIAEAFLKHPDKTCIFCHSESITGESELGDQLFKTRITKDIGKHRDKNWFTGSDGLVPKDEESPMLKHLMQWYESVVIIDEYDKMKMKSAKPGSTMKIQGVAIPVPGQQSAADAVDNSADEILRSIASTGKYTFMNKTVDCSKTLFLITTNETREEIERNFGIGGIKGGGAQRLNIIEFDYLSEDACRGIVNDMLENVTASLTDSEGPFRLGGVVFDDETKDKLTKYIFNDKVAQGRAKNKLEDGIRGLMSRSMGKDYGKNIKIIFNDEGSGEFKFAREEIQ